MAKRERFCWHCGESIGLMSAGYDERDFVCEREACQRAADKQARPDREYEHEECLERDARRWSQWEEQRVNDQQRPSALDAVRTVDAGDHVEAGNIRAVSRPVANSKAR